MQIPPNIIDEVLKRIDIVELIGKELKLKKVGNNHFACCPFHQEKSPSFSISAQKQIFHCFGCGAAGNAINFVMQYRGFDFADALYQLADSCGVVIPKTESKLTIAQIKRQKQQKLNLRQVLDQATMFYQRNLQISANLPQMIINAKDYLQKRGLNQAIMDCFLVGFAPDNDALKTVFADYTTNNLLVEAGLVVKKDNQVQWHDRFRNRLIFPIRNTLGEVIAFGSRIIHNGEPKYLNSPQTPLFNKSQELYGLYEAQGAIRQTHKVLVVEGYMDVIALHQHGVNYAVATMGTATTDDHVKKILRLANDVYFCFDGDLAGKKAAWRALERSIANIDDNKTINFLFLPSEHDPDSFIRQYGAKVFNQELTASSMTLSQLLLKQLSLDLNLLTDEGKAKLISLVKPYIEQIKALALQVMLKKQLAALVELEPVVLESILNNRSRYAFYNGRSFKGNSGEKLAAKAPITMLNNIDIIMQHALEYISWVLSYKLPDDINAYGQEIQELAIVLDFISNNYSVDEQLDVQVIEQQLQLSSLNLTAISQYKSIVVLTESEFYQMLDRIFGVAKNKVIRIPKIAMKGES